MNAPSGAGARPAALSLPREDWPGHPHFPHQTLLLHSHESFRRTGALLLRRARDGGDAPGIGKVFRAWKSAMRSHEAYEEFKLYPYLERRWGLSMHAAERGHRALGDADAAVREALASGPASPALCDALDRHQEVLLAHLELEEQLVIPALLALTPDEFEQYTTWDIRSLLQGLELRDG